MRSPRKPLSKRTRFEVFKRDGFTCQYCGKQPPDVILHCDHIDPVVGGGSDDLANLITSCRDCNLGKGAVPLGDIRPSPDSELTRLERLQELEELRAYTDTAAEADSLRERVVESLCDLWTRVWRTSYAPDEAIETWIGRYGPNEVDEAIRCCEGKNGQVCGSYQRRCYVGAVLRNRRNQALNHTCETCRHSFVSKNSVGAECIGCALKPAPGDNRFYIVLPGNSCRHWVA